MLRTTTWRRRLSSPSLPSLRSRATCRCEYSSQQIQQHHDHHDLPPTSQSRHASTTWKHLHPAGRIVGSGRKRQRVTSVDLVRKSLDKPASVVILQDFHHRGHGTPESASLVAPPASQPQKTLSPQEIERVISSRNIVPDEAEISESIQMLRPDCTVMDRGPFETLRQHLVDAYTLPQLSRYLITALRPPSATLSPRTGLQHHNKVIHASAWQPGQTALDMRRTKLVKSATLSRKARAADRILRLVWKISVHSEEREIGELELALQPWQLSMLFDLTYEGQAYYRRLLSSQLLSKTTTILPWRPDGVVRIVGRRRDAEEVAYQLELALNEVGRLTMDLANFATATTRAMQVDELCSKRELDYISRLTQSVIMVEQHSTVAIYNRTVAGRNHARRLLLSLLTSSPRAVQMDVTFGKHVPDDRPACCFLPANATSLGLHLRDTEHKPTRRVMRNAGPSAIQIANWSQRHEAASTIASYLQSLDTAHPIEHDGTSRSDGYWRTESIAPNEWQAEVVRLLQPELVPKEGLSLRNGEHDRLSPLQTVVQRHSPGVEEVLSSLHVHKSSGHGLGQPTTIAMRAADDPGPRLVAHLVPDWPFKNRSRPPRLEAHFTLTSLQQCELHLVDMRAIIDHQAIEVPLYSSSVDLLFTRSKFMIADIELVQKDAHFAAFVQALQESIRATASTISGLPEVLVQLPASLLGTQSTTGDLPVKYLLERFEQTQARIFVMDGSIPSRNKSDVTSVSRFSENSMALEYKEVEGDIVRGSSSVLTVKHIANIPPDRVHHGSAKTASANAVQTLVDAAKREGRAAETRPSPALPVYQTALAALHVSKLLTDATIGSLKASSPVE